MSLERLLRPKTIAVIGGGAWCAAVIEQCRRSGYTGQLSAVHPSRDSIAGASAVPSVEQLPWSPDASFIGVNRSATVSVLSELSHRDAGGAVCFASGFQESEDEAGATLQQALLSAANGLSILGPNCYGYINNLDGAALWPDQHGLVREQTGVAIITQSSNIAINLTMQKRGLPIAYVITTGNQAQQDLATVAMSLLNDSRVTAIGLHIEGLKDVAGFEHFMRQAHAQGVPVAAIKVGASLEAQTATQSHTASLAGSQAGAQALLNRLGVATVNTLPELLETLKLFHVYKTVPGGRLASLSCSGGEASLVADAVHRFKGLSLPAVSESAESVLHESLGPHVSKVNPLDYHTDIWRNQAAMSKVFSAMTGEPFDLTLLVLDFPRSDRCSDEDWLITIEAIIDAARQPHARVAVLASLVENLPEHHARTLMENGIAPLMELDVAFSALSAVLKCTAVHEDNVWPPVASHSKASATVLDEACAKVALAGYGVEIPAHRVVHSPQQAGSAAVELNQPVVVKGLGHNHKSEHGLVAINLTSIDEVEQAAKAMQTHTTKWLVESMVNEVLLELLLGVVHDPAHGFVLTIASGGVLTEILNDSVSLMMPVTRYDIESALSELQVLPILNGYRGKPGCNLDAIVDQALSLQRFVEANKTCLREVEINPLLCTANAAIAADALLLIDGEALA